MSKKFYGGDNMAKKKQPKGIPKKDGSGRGIQANKGRGGCTPPKKKNRVKK